MKGLQREDCHDSTSPLWTNPSPNLRNLAEATLYPGFGTIEMWTISVGLGIDTFYMWTLDFICDARKKCRLTRRMIEDTLCFR
jgi:uncharacterized protein YbbC (DUF1343 family)